MATKVNLSAPAILRIVSVLENCTPLSSHEIAEKAAISHGTLTGGGYLKAMKTAKLIHIAGWRQSACGFATALFALGDKEDCIRPKVHQGNRDSDGMQRIVKALEMHGPMTYREIGLKADLAHTTIKNAKYMEALVAQERVHILTWRRSKMGPMSAIYEAGSGPNASKPKPFDQAEKSRRHRFKKWALSEARTVAGICRPKPIPASLAGRL